MIALAAAGLASVAVALLARGPRPLRRPGRGRRATGLVGSLPIGVGFGWVTAALLGAKALALTILVSLVAALVLQIVRRDRARARAAGLRRDVVEMCESLAGDVRAGSDPALALARAAHQWPLLATVAKSAELGADVPSALRELAPAPGAESLEVTAAAWQVSQVTGSGLAGALERCAESARADLATADLVAGELATARATARMLSLLPVVVLALGRGMGLDPWSFLIGSWPGIGCLCGGLLLSWAGLQWMDRIGAAVAR